MEVRVFWIGKTRLPGVAELTEEYGRRLHRFCDFRGEEIRPGRRKSGAGSGEENAMLARSSDSHLIVLDAAGRSWNSGEFASFLMRMRDRGTQALSFCVGGADGFSASFRERANLLLSLSPLTMPHELARVVLLEHLIEAMLLERPGLAAQLGQPNRLRL